MPNYSKNTGNEIIVKLLKVRTDIIDPNDPYYQEALDDDNNPCRLSGKPQSTKDNIQGDPDYIAPRQNLIKCPKNM